MRDQNTNDEMHDLIQRNTQVEIPAEVEDRLRHRLAEFRTRVEQRPPSRWRSLADSLTYRPPVRVMAMVATALVAVAVGLVFIPRASNASRVYAAAAQQLRSSQSLEYTIVLNDTPYVAVDFSYAAPGYQRLNCSWGIEVRADHTAGKQIVLIHFMRSYVVESGKQVERIANSEDMVEQLLSLPPSAEQVLGEKQAGDKRLIGYRLPTAALNTSFSGLQTFDMWVDAATRQADHVDIAIQEPGKPVHQMHINNIRVDGQIDRSVFDLTPPAGYTLITAPSAESRAGKPALPQKELVLQPQIVQSAALTAAMLPMTGSYLQARSALERVESYLKTVGVTPVGPPLGRFGSEQSWDAGYPVPQGTSVEAPLQLVSLPSTLVASVVVNEPWGTDSTGRWSAFLKSVVEQGYLPAGPPMEIWSGEDAKVQTQSTEMRIAVTKAN
jgi:outer membrane lipoprotein-sorting protein